MMSPMLTLHRIQSAQSPYYPFAEALLQQAFPPEEYRDLAEWRRYTDEKTLFHNHVILQGDEPMGLITYWTFDGFCYIEHFATAPAARNKGYGSKVLTLLQEMLNTPLVLEVEEPKTPIAIRRIAFYERMGFVLWDKEYLQPPYRPGDDFLPLRLMAWGALDAIRDFTRIRQTIYREVYNLPNECK